MTTKPISLLGYALLGLVQQRPSSGYDLRKMFAETAMGSFSDSPGAIYPALTRLEKRGLIRSEVEERAALRRRRLYRLTPKGRAELLGWLTLPITRNEIIRGQGEVMLRFAFIESALGAGAALKLLREFHQQLATYLPELKNFLEANKKKMPLSAMLALDSGIRGHEALLKWAQYGIGLYERRRKGVRK